MAPDDLPALVDLWVAAWRATFPAIDFEARRGWIATFLREPAHVTWVGVAVPPLRSGGGGPPGAVEGGAGTSRANIPPSSNDARSMAPQPPPCFAWSPSRASRGRMCGFVSLEGDHLHQLVVAPLDQGRGVATRLLDAAKAQAPAGLSLEVNQANARAVRFYEREGFVTTGDGRNATSGLATWTMRWRP